MHLEVAYTRSPVFYLTNDDMHLCVLKRVGGPSDATLPRYYMAVGRTREHAKKMAVEDAVRRVGQDLELRV
jgi:hypothetical protein